MSTFVFVLSMGGVLAVTFVYMWRRERSLAAVCWAGSWASLYAAGLVITGAPGEPFAAIAASNLGLLFSVLLFVGALAFAGRRIPRWVLPVSVAVIAGDVVTHLVIPSAATLFKVVAFELPALIAAAAIIHRSVKSRSASLPERALAPTFLVIAVVDVLDAVSRVDAHFSNDWVPLWLSAMLAVAMIQLTALFERSLARERRLLEQLEQARKLETVGRLAGGVAHDFNNQLVAILGNAELLRDRLGNDDESVQGLHDLEAAARHCAGLTEGLLAFARRSHTTPRAIDLETLLADLGRRLRPLLPESVRLSTHCDPGLPPVLADPVQIERVLTNLVMNARDAIRGAGEIRVEARTSAQIGSGLPEEARGFVELQVCDDGAGIDPATREQMFDPFFTTKPHGQGTGLGLAVVYGIVTAHGGSIAVESLPTDGTTFRLLWPASRDPVTVSPRSEPVEAVRGRETILLADDEPAVRAIARRALESRGFTVIEAEDGAAALALFREHRSRIQGAVLDLSMPGIDGAATLRGLRSLVPDLPVVLMSGDLARQSDDLPPADVPLLAKPFGVDALVQVVREALDRRLHTA